MVGEALASGVEIESVYVDRSASPDGAVDSLLEAAYAAGSRVFDLAPGVLARVAHTVSPQPVMAVVRQMDVPLAALRPAARPGTGAAPAAAARPGTDAGAGAGADLIVVCVDLRDPGNAGTVLRSAEAAGATGLVCCNGSVDLFNPKTVRASAGSLFRLPVVAGGEPADVLAELGSWGLTRLASTPRGGAGYSEVDLTRPVVLVVGNEAHGLPGGLDALIDGWLTIPMAGRAESLNAGMAAAVLLFEAARQRRLAGSEGPTPGPGRADPAGRAHHDSRDAADYAAFDPEVPDSGSRTAVRVGP